jgi:glycine/serine hydroxymethyltransferase
MKEPEMQLIVEWIDQALTNYRDEKRLGILQNQIREFCQTFPLPK